MISYRVPAVAMCFVLAACTPDEPPEFCSDHPLFHAEHATSNAFLSVTMTEDGSVDSELRLPAATFADGIAADLLSDSSNVYAIQSAAACTTQEASVTTKQKFVTATYSSQCGADNKLGQIDVRLFDVLPQLEEIEVTVITPVTQKHFAINRQCESAIFRLE